MTWYTYACLLTLSSLLLGSALAFHRAARTWAMRISSAFTALNALTSDARLPGTDISPNEIQHSLIPPGVFLWFWIGLLSTTGILATGVFQLGYISFLPGLAGAYIVARIGRGIWPQPASVMYSSAFYECLQWRLRTEQLRHDTKRAEQLATLIAAMEQLNQTGAKPVSQAPAQPSSQPCQGQEQSLQSGKAR